MKKLAKDKCERMKSRGDLLMALPPLQGGQLKGPSENELNAARFQGRHISAIALKLK